MSIYMNSYKKCVDICFKFNNPNEVQTKGDQHMMLPLPSIAMCGPPAVDPLPLHWRPRAPPPPRQQWHHHSRQGGGGWRRSGGGRCHHHHRATGGHIQREGRGGAA